MFLIIDNNVTGLIIQPGNDDGRAILEWLSPTRKAVAGGELRREYLPENGGNAKFIRLFNQLAAAGKALMIPDKAVDVRTEELRSSPNIKSNDHHVIALAQISGARAIWTDDEALKRDFKNAALLNHPRGRCYSPRNKARWRAVGLIAITKVCEQ